MSERAGPQRERALSARAGPQREPALSVGAHRGWAQ